MEGFKDLVSDVGGTDISNLHRGMIGISKILQTNANPPIQEVIDANLVSKIVGFLESTNSPQLQLSASQALKHIASGTSEQCKPIFDKGGIPLIVGLLGSKDTGMKCESV
jgi:importin subunit alpha-2